MASCDSCGKTILFGGVRDDVFRFCNEECHKQARVLTAASELPQDLVSKHVDEVHQGECPKCGGRGPVDVHTSYWVCSAILATWHSSKPQVCCQSCGTKSKLAGLATSLVLGPWGFPWGLIMTPIQVVRNMASLLSSHDPFVPSPKLESMVRIKLASRMAPEIAPESDE